MFVFTRLKIAISFPIKSACHDISMTTVSTKATITFIQSKKTIKMIFKNIHYNFLISVDLLSIY